MHHTADVADLAVALTSVLRNTSDTQVSSPWELAGATLRGYQRLRPLSRDEVEVLGELVLSRLVPGTIISRGRAAAHPDNTAYITQYDDANARTTTELALLAPAELAGRLHRLAGTRTASAGSDVAGRPADAMGGTVAPLCYDRPLQVVSGEGAWLTAADDHPSSGNSGWFYGLDDYRDLWANPNMTRTPLSDLGLTGDVEVEPPTLEAAAADFAAAGDELAGQAGSVRGLRVPAGSLGRVPQAAALATAGDQLLDARPDSLRTGSAATDAVATLLRSSATDYERTDEGVQSGFRGLSPG